MNDNYCYVDEKVLDSYIKKYFNKENLLIGSDYEVLCALLIRLFCEDLYKLDCLISFKLKQKYTKEQVSPKNQEECKFFFKNIVDNDTPVDFAVSPLVTFNQKRNTIFA